MVKVEGISKGPAVQQSRLRVPMGGVQLMVDASAPQTAWLPGWFSIPVAPLARTTLRVADIMYQSGLAARIADVDYHARKRMWGNPPRWAAPGSKVPKPQWHVEDLPGSSPPLAIGARLTQLPGEMARKWTVDGELPHWETGPMQYRADLKSAENKLSTESREG